MFPERLFYISQTQIHEYKRKKLCKCDTECFGCSLSSQRRLLPSLIWLVLIEPWEAFLYLTQLFLKLQIHEYKRKKLCKCDTWVHTKQISHSIKAYFVPATASLVKFSSQSRRVLAVVSALSVICNCPAILGQKTLFCLNVYKHIWHLIQSRKHCGACWCILLYLSLNWNFD